MKVAVFHKPGHIHICVDTVEDPRANYYDN